MVTVSSIRGFLDAIRGARDIVIGTYVLQTHGKLFEELAQACRRGAHVTIRVASEPYNSPSAALGNAHAVDALRALGGDARLQTGTHIKGAVVDGTGFLDDCNWKEDGSDTILRDTSPSDVRMIRHAVDGKADATTQSFSTKKDDALAEECTLLASATAEEDVIVETESISYGSVALELATLAKQKHCSVRVLVNKRDLEGSGARREATTLEWLEKSGVDVRLSSATEKFAVVGDNAWVGSANVSTEDATLRKAHPNMPDTVEWGMRTSRSAVTTHLRSAFESRWGKVASPTITFRRYAP